MNALNVTVFGPAGSGITVVLTLAVTEFQGNPSAWALDAWAGEVLRISTDAHNCYGLPTGSHR